MGMDKPGWLCRKSVNQICLWPLSVSLAMIYSAGSSPLQAAEETGTLPADSSGPPGIEQPDSSRDFLKRQALLPLLYRDRPQTSTLQQADNSFRNGQSLEAIQYLQHLFDAPGDSFYWPDKLQSPISLRTAARRLFLKQDLKDWETYQQLYEPQAAALLQQATQLQNPSFFEQIVRRYPFTSSGQQAQFYLAQYAFDHCRFREAGQRMRELLELRTHITKDQNRSLNPHSMTRTEIKLMRMIDLVLNETAPASVEKPAPTQLAMKPIETVWEKPARTDSFQLANAQLISHESQRDGKGLKAPYLVPVWEKEFVSSEQEVLSQMLTYWELGQRKDLQSQAVIWQPVVKQGVIYLRDYEGVEAVSLESGRTLWRSPTITRFSNLLEGYRSQAHSRSRTQIAQLISEINLDQILVGNNLLGRMSVDEDHLYLVDDVDLAALRSPIYARSGRLFGQKTDTDDKNLRTNRLVAISLDPEASAQGNSDLPAYRVPVAWSLGGEGNGSSSQNPLTGHFFLGPPLVAQNRLYLLTEYEQQINLVALDARQGQLLWMQGLAWVEKTIDRDDFRGHRAATPVESEGILICPCQNGIFVAVEKTTGNLLWVYDYRDSVHEQSQRRWGAKERTLHGHLGFGDQPLIAEGLLFHLPVHSDYLHAVSVYTGTESWKIPRKDAEYIGEVTPETVLLIGRRYCRGVSVQDGSELWSLRIGIPSGRGFSDGDFYYAPLQSGEIATINMKSGLLQGMSHLLNRGILNPAGETNPNSDQQETKSWSPGNLLAYQGKVVSVNGRELSVFPQVDSVQDQLQRNSVPGTETSEELFTAATVLMVMNRLGEAQSKFERYFASADSRKDKSQYRLARNLYRELHYTRLHASIDGTQEILDELASQVKTPEEQGRLLMEQVRICLHQEDYAEAWRCTELLSQIDLNTPLPSLKDATHVGTPMSWIPVIRKQILRSAPEAFRQQLTARREQIHYEALETNDLQDFRRYLTLYSDDGHTETLRSQYAMVLEKTGLAQQAELQWLYQLRNSRQQFVRQNARQKLYSLWARHGLNQQATVMRRDWELKAYDGELLELEHQLQSPSKEANLSDSIRQLCLRQQSELTQPVTEVQITENRWDGLPENLDGFRRVVPTSLTSDYQLVTRGSGHTGKLSILDRLSGKLVEELEVPSGTLSQQLGRQQLCGNAIAMGGNRNAVGISLLTRQKIWDLEQIPGLKKESLRIGPVSELYTVLRNRHQLAVLQTGTGKLVWQRNQMGAPGTQINTGQAGVIGDDQAVVTFEKLTNYNVYDIRDGREVRQGKLRLDAGERHYVFGRKMFFHEPGSQGNQICLYDPLEDRYVFRRTVEGPVFSTRTSDNELALLAAKSLDPQTEVTPYLLEIVDPETEAVKLQYTLQEKETGNLSFFRVFSDRDHYYINLQHHNSNLNLPRQYYPAGDALLSNITIRGDLLAFDKSSGKMLWRRTFQPCSVLMLEPYRIPCLVMLSRTRDKVNPNRHSLAVEAVDLKTGQRLGFHEEILTDRLVHANYDPEGQLLSLFGHRTEVRLEFVTRKIHNAILQHRSQTF